MTSNPPTLPLRLRHRYPANPPSSPVDKINQGSGHNDTPTEPEDRTEPLKGSTE